MALNVIGDELNDRPDVSYSNICYETSRIFRSQNNISAVNYYIERCVDFLNDLCEKKFECVNNFSKQFVEHVDASVNDSVYVEKLCQAYFRVKQYIHMGLNTSATPAIFVSLMQCKVIVYDVFQLRYVKYNIFKTAITETGLDIFSKIGWPPLFLLGNAVYNNNNTENFCGAKILMTPMLGASKQKHLAKSNPFKIPCLASRWMNMLGH